MVQVHLRDNDISMLLYCLCFNEAYFERSLIMLSSNFNYRGKSKHLVLFVLKALTVTLISSTVLFLYQAEQEKLLSNSFPSKVVYSLRKVVHLQIISFLKNTEEAMYRWPLT